MSVPVATKGRTRDILERLYKWVEEVLRDNYDEYYMTIDDRIDVMNIMDNEVFPLVTIRVDPVVIGDVAYGRKMPDSGSLASYSFSMHVFEKYNEDPLEDYNRDAHNCTELIVSKLTSKNQSLVEMTSHGIFSVRDVSFRESDPNVRDVARVIVEGYIDVIREDSP